jgi:hypothetical protein
MCSQHRTVSPMIRLLLPILPSPPSIANRAAVLQSGVVL